MYFINEWLRYINSPDEERAPAWDYELHCRVHLTGELDFGWAQFRFWEIPPADTMAVRAVLLRLRFRENETEEILRLPPRLDQHYHPKGTAGEFECLISLFTRAHFSLIKGTDSGSTPLFKRYASRADVARTDVDGKTIKLSEIEKYFVMLRQLREVEINSPHDSLLSARYVRTFIMAARFYHLAQSLIADDSTLAYICLVSSIECMLEHYQATKYGLADVNPDATRLLVEYVKDHDQRTQLEAAILKFSPRIRTRFADFISENLAEAFWKDPTRPMEPFRFVDQEEARKYALRVYDARSKAIHQGEPFPVELGRELERPMAHGMAIGNTKEWKESELLPSVRAFERLVHHVLIQSLKERADRLYSEADHA